MYHGGIVGLNEVAYALDVQVMLLYGALMVQVPAHYWLHANAALKGVQVPVGCSHELCSDCLIP